MGGDAARHWGDPERYKRLLARSAEQGWAPPAKARATTWTGAVRLLGRIDDVMNVSGHRLSTAEVESALVGHSVAEAAVVGATDETTGQAIVGLVMLLADHDEPRANR